jgi:hypothetical protein
MRKIQWHGQKLHEASVQVTYDEASLVSNMIYAAILNMTALNDTQRKMTQHFMVKLQRAALSISRQPTR